MKLPNSYYNTMSFFGSLISGFSFALIVFLFIVSTFFMESGGYIGLIIYIVLPVFLVVGLIMIPLGMRIKIRKEKKRYKRRDKMEGY